MKIQAGKTYVDNAGCKVYIIGKCKDGKSFLGEYCTGGVIKLSEEGVCVNCTSIMLTNEYKEPLKYEATVYMIRGASSTYCSLDLPRDSTSIIIGSAKVILTENEYTQ